MRVRLNPDKNKIVEIRKAIEENDGYCCCMIERNEDTKCPCYEFRYNQNCHCGLYEKVED
jgi:ferredoxin-thioredoxin reductase catalytic subunit